MTPAPHIRTADLGKRFGRNWILSHVDLEVQGGEVLLLAGPNGSGKSTLLRLISGLLRPSVGRVAIHGFDPIKESHGARRHMAVLDHQLGVYPLLSALEHLKIADHILGRPRRRADLLPLLERVGLAQAADRPLEAFSAGMKKRMAMARTLLQEPDIVLLDEPLAALDPAGHRMVADWVEELGAQGSAVVIAEHRVGRMAPSCTRALVLRDGQVAWMGPPEAVAEHLEGPDPLPQESGK